MSDRFGVKKSRKGQMMIQDQKNAINHTKIKAIWIVLSILGLIAVYGSYSYFITQIISLSQASAFGDAFGFITSLVTALTFIALIGTLYLQMCELKMQREELKMQREEMKRSSRAQSQQASISAIATRIEARNSLVIGLERRILNVQKIMSNEKNLLIVRSLRVCPGTISYD